MNRIKLADTKEAKSLLGKDELAVILYRPSSENGNRQDWLESDWECKRTMARAKLHLVGLRL